MAGQQTFAPNRPKKRVKRHEDLLDSFLHANAPIELIVRAIHLNRFGIATIALARRRRRPMRR